MKHLFILLSSLVCATPLSAQDNIDVSKFPKGITPIGHTINGHDNLVHVECEKNGKKYEGIYTINGKEIVPCIYQYVGCFENGISVMNEERTWGVYDYTGTCVLKVMSSVQVFPYSGMGIRYVNQGGRPDENDNLEAVGGKWGIANESGKLVVSCNYDNLCPYSVDFNDFPSIALAKRNKWGVIDFDENILVPFRYDGVKFLGNYDKDLEKWFFGINKSCICKKSGNGPDTFRFEGGKWGVCDKNGKVIVPCIYDGVEYSGDLLFTINEGGVSAGQNAFHVKTNGGKWGLYGDGRELLPCIYDEPIRLKNDVATLKKDGEVRLIKNPLKDGAQIQIAENNVVSKKKKNNGSAVSRYPAPNSDVDKDIPNGKQNNDNTFAFIIANENYPDTPVPYSLNDGRIFKEYCSKTLGIPEKNINMYEDATFGTIIAAVEKMKSIADAYDGEASLIFYYAGHGFPDEKQSTAYLLPIDGNASDITTTGYSLAKLYKDLASLKLKSSVVFLDACFSGAKREDNMLASSRGVAIKVKEEAPTGNMVVFSAAQGDETAHQLEEKGHGLFTYYLLKELQQTNGDVTLGELSEFVTKQVKRQSVVINNKKQTPTVIPSQAVVNCWQSMKLK